ncbi:MAG TPA: hypothetical protein VJR89_17160 [Polyangiales bacterium]|nr:hypothetical protein [Polyangiales bacterium]
MHRPSLGTSFGLALLLAACGGSKSGTGDQTVQPTAGVSAPGFTPGVSTPGAAGVTGTAAASGTTGLSAGRSGTSSGGTGTAPSGASGTTASGGMTGGLPAAGSGMPAGNPMDKGNYFQSGAWHGYAWTSAAGPGSSIMPMDFSMQTTGMPRCVKGSVGAAADFSGSGILGLNLNQDNGSMALGTVTPTKAGVMIDLKYNTMSALRFQVTAGMGASQQRWCASITGTGGFIAWSSLNTACWDGSGMAYKNEPINAAMILVPGQAMAAVPFDFCLNSLVESDAPAGGTSGTGAMAAGTGAGAAAGGTGGSGAAGTAAGTGGTPSTDPPKYPPITGGCSGFATRYWDCCKPHCGWAANVPGGSPLPACDRSDNNVGSPDAANSCTGGNAFMCHSLAPWAVNSQLSFGYSAVAARTGADICGKCFQLDFSGSSHNAGNDPGSSALRGKTMIIQAINIGGDVAGGQFDISVPGGGVGQFNACSTQWGVASSQLGQTYGGFLATCKSQANASDHNALKSCVMQKCTSVFESKGLTELMAGCKWFVDWFEVADNPALKYQEVACPNELMNKGVRRNASPSNACLGR